MTETEVWSYITKCRQLLFWQLSEEENADLREILFPALARPAQYNRHETLAGRLRDTEYAGRLRDLMHIYHRVVMDVCDWMIYNKEYFHLLIASYTTFGAFADAVDAAILDECRGTQSRVWTRAGMVELDEPILVGTPRSSLDSSPATSASALEELTAVRVPLTHAPTHRSLSALTHLPASTAVQPKHTHTKLLSTPPSTPPSPASAQRESVLFKPEPEIIAITAESVATRTRASPALQQSLDLLDTELAPRASPHALTRRSRATTVSEPRPLTAPSGNTAPAPLSSATIPGPSPLAFGERTSEPSADYTPHPASPASPDYPGPTFEIATPFFTPSRAPTPPIPTPPRMPASEIATPLSSPSPPVLDPASPVEPTGPTFDLPTPLFVPARPPPASPLGPIPTPLAPDGRGPTLSLNPLFTYATAQNPEPASPDEPRGPTFEVATPFFTYAAFPPKSGLAPRSTSPIPDEPRGPTFQLATPGTPLPDYAAIPGVKVIAPSIASSAGVPVSSEAHISPRSDAFPSTTCTESESCPSPTTAVVIIPAENFRFPAAGRQDTPPKLESGGAAIPAEPHATAEPEPAESPPTPAPRAHARHPSNAANSPLLKSDPPKSTATTAPDTSTSTSPVPARTLSGPGTARTPKSPGSRSARSLPSKRTIWDRERGFHHREPNESKRFNESNESKPQEPQEPQPLGPRHRPGPRSAASHAPGPPRIRPVSSSGSLQHWWKIGVRRNSAHSEE